MQSDPTDSGPGPRDPGGSEVDELVRRTASLARLEVDDEDVQRLGPQFARILEAFQTLAQLDVGSVPAMTRAGGDRPCTRDDREAPSLPVRAALENAPEHVESFYSVPKAIPSPPSTTESDAR